MKKKPKTLTGKAAVAKLAECVLFALNNLKGSGVVFDKATGKCTGSWHKMFTDALGECGIKVKELP